MRSNQVTITIERFGKYVPEGYPNDTQKIHIYCDDFNSIYVALSKAYALAINELAEYENICCRADVCTNEFTNNTSVNDHGAIIEWKRKYEEDVNLEYTDTNIELCKDRIWIYENSHDIIETLKECEGDIHLSTVLKEKFSLNGYQIKKLSQMRFDMMTKKEYEMLKEKIERLENKTNHKDSYELYKKRERNKIKKEIDNLNSYFILVKHFEKISNLTLFNDFDYDLIDLISKKYGISKDYVRNFKYMSLNDFSKTEQSKNRERLKYLEHSLKLYSD